MTQAPFAVRFADGAEDGAAIFHRGVAHREPDGLETVLQMIRDKNEAAQDKLSQLPGGA